MSILGRYVIFKGLFCALPKPRNAFSYDTSRFPPPSYSLYRELLVAFPKGKKKYEKRNFAERKEQEPVESPVFTSTLCFLLLEFSEKIPMGTRELKESEGVQRDSPHTAPNTHLVIRDISVLLVVMGALSEHSA